MLLSILYVSLLEFGKKEIEGEEESAHQTRDEERKGGKTPDMDREERGRKQPLFPAHAFYPRRHDDGTEKYLFVFGIPRFLYLSAPPLATAASSSSPRRSRRECPLLNLKIFCSLTRLIEQVSLLGRPNAKKDGPHRVGKGRNRRTGFPLPAPTSAPLTLSPRLDVGDSPPPSVPAHLANPLFLLRGGGDRPRVNGGEKETKQIPNMSRSESSSADEIAFYPPIHEASVSGSMCR